MVKTLDRDEYLPLSSAATQLELSRHALLIQLAMRGMRLEKIGGHLMLRTVLVELLRDDLAAAPRSA
jgi:hypothetical protein